MSGPYRAIKLDGSVDHVHRGGALWRLIGPRINIVVNQVSGVEGMARLLNRAYAAGKLGETIEPGNSAKLDVPIANYDQADLEQQKPEEN